MRLLRLAVTGLAVAAMSSVALAAAPPAAEPPGAAPWLSPDWTARRIVEAKVAGSPYAGGDAAVCTFYGGGLVKPDGSDIRVAVRGNKLVSHRVIQTGPGDLVRVAFAAIAAETRYYVYYGNPKAPPPEPWEPQRGVLLEARSPGRPGPADTLAQVKAAWAKAAPIGADFVSHVNFGFNPFADSDTPAIFHFTGWFVPPAPGMYSFDVSSNGGSWLQIDEKDLIAWPGPHPPSGHARRAKTVNLTQTMHRLDFWNVNQPSPLPGTVIVVVWQVPQTGRFEPVPAKAFLPVVQAALIETDLPKEHLVADFFAENAGETWWPDQYAVRMRFRNLSKPAGAAANVKFQWDFGDGQTSALASPTHIYLAAGTYTVSLKCVRPADSSTFATKVHVDRNWWRQLDPAIDPIKVYADEAAQYNLSKLDVRSLLKAVSLFEHESRDPALVASAAELLKRPEVKEPEAHRLGMLMGEHLRQLGQPAPAMAAYRDLEARVKAAPLKAQAAVQIGDILLNDLRRYDEADKEFQRVLKTYATSGADAALRRARLGMGDIWRHRGDGDKARQAYSAAAALKVVSYPPNEAAVRIGTLARNVEEYTREKQWEWAFKNIDDWAWEFPGDKLQGHWSLLKSTALVANGNPAAALLEASDALAASPANPYAVRLLMLAADCQVALKQSEKARLLLQTAAEDYPEDPYQDKAREKLKALGGAVKTDGKPEPKPAATPEPKTAPPAKAKAP